MCYVWSILVQAVKISCDFSLSQGFFCFRDQDSSMQPVLNIILKKTHNKRLPFVWDCISGIHYLRSFRKWVILGKTKYCLELRLSGSFHYGLLFLWLNLPEFDRAVWIPPCKTKIAHKPDACIVRRVLQNWRRWGRRQKQYWRTGEV